MERPGYLDRLAKERIAQDMNRPPPAFDYQWRHYIWDTHFNGPSGPRPDRTTAYNLMRSYQDVKRRERYPDEDYGRYLKTNICKTDRKNPRLRKGFKNRWEVYRAKLGGFYDKFAKD